MVVVFDVGLWCGTRGVREGEVGAVCDVKCLMWDMCCAVCDVCLCLMLHWTMQIYKVNITDTVVATGKVV